MAGEMDKIELDTKQKEHPNEESANADLEKEALTPFNSDELRLKLQKIGEERQSEENLKHRQRLILRTLIIAVLSLSVVIVIILAGKGYQASKLEQQAALTAVSLDNKYQSADSFMNAGRPEEALRLYSEIQKMDPSYKGIGQKIESAKLSITVIGLYQQGTQALLEGKSDKALEILLMVEKLHPKYKDTPELINKIEQEKQIASLIKEIENSYSQEDWAGVIHNYEAIQVIDPFIQFPELKDMLFMSYRSLILDFAERTDLTLEDIETAENYYRNALALVPQSKEYAKEREELQKIAVERLATKYYLHAINLIESSNYSSKGLRESIRILTKANNIGSDSPVINAEIEKAQLFLDSYDNLLQRKWDNAIDGFETLRRKEENYAGGRVEYFLYEAYIARGDLLFAYADFEGAFLDYQEAEKIAWGDEGNLLRLFQIEIRIATSLDKFDKIDESAEYYNYIFERLGYEKMLTSPEEQDLLDTLNQADLAYKNGDKLGAIRLYKIAMEQQEKIYDQITVMVKQGDTLANIAFENGSTIESLRIANKISESMIVDRDQEFLIPVISTNGQ